MKFKVNLVAEFDIAEEQLLALSSLIDELERRAAAKTINLMIGRENERSESQEETE